MSTKFPVCAVLMELTLQLERKGLPLSLHWTPREQNREADALSNGQFGDFDMANRVEITEDSIKYLLLPERLMKGALLYGVDEAEKADKRKKAASSKMSGKKTPKGERLKVAAPW